MEKDPLDEPSDVYVMRGDKIVQLSFRDLQKECRYGSGMMETWDAIGKGLRDRNQLANDPDYKPIAPYAGRRKYRRWRG